MKKIKIVLIVVWSIIVTVVLAIVYMFISLANGWSGYIPDTSVLENPEYLYASQLMTADGKEMGTWSRENRIRAEFKDIPQHLINALVATEDVRYFEHSGIDGQSLMRVGVKSILMRQENSGGGSTITQQLAKMLHTKPESGMMARVRQKPNEWVIAAKLEKQYTKNEIITMYLNKYDFGNNAVGIASAAYVYFGKHPSELNIQESATLVGMCKNSSLYNPRTRPKKTRQRRNVVLSQMKKAGYITAAECDSLSKLDLELNYHTTDHNEGIAPYFREYLRRYMTASKPERKNYPYSWQKQQFYDDSLRWATDSLYGWCNRNFKPNGEKYNIYTDGLKIYTTIDSRMQAYLEEAVHQHVADTLQPRFFNENNPAKVKDKAKSALLKKTAPYSSDVTEKQVKEILAKTMKQSTRYKVMKEKGYSAEEIEKAFNTATSMKVFTYQGMKDTIMTPMDSIRYYKHFLRVGAMSMDPLTGEVKAYVGGTDYHHFKYDMVSNGRRQVGSTIKPFLYSLAMERGFTPCDEVCNVQPVLFDDLGRPWRPSNSSTEREGETVTLRWGLAKSNNWISAHLMSQLSPYSLKKLIHEFGLSNQQIDATLSLCLGSCDASVSEMVSAYTAFVGKGIRVAPLMVTRIEDNAGNVIAKFTAHRNHVISPESSYKMIDMMRGVINEGTGRSLRKNVLEPKVTKDKKGKKKIIPYSYYEQGYGLDSVDMAGKTGTTNLNSDAWFIGYTPSLVTGCWVGGEERSIHFDNMKDGQGARAAMPIYGHYMRKLYADESLPYNREETFVFPEDYDPCDSKYKIKPKSENGDGIEGDGNEGDGIEGDGTEDNEILDNETEEGENVETVRGDKNQEDFEDMFDWE